MNWTDMGVESVWVGDTLIWQKDGEGAWPKVASVATVPLGYDERDAKI